MYKIVYTKTALKDIPKLKSAHLDEKGEGADLHYKRKSVPEPAAL